MNPHSPDRRDSGRLRSWIYGLALPLAYGVVELSFSNALIHTLGDHSPDDVLNGFEFWGRIISGFGLGLLIHRLVLKHLPAKALGLLLCIAGGMVIMWNVQKTLLDHLIDVAEPSDKRAALALVWIAPMVPDGSIKTLSGQSLILTRPEGIDRNITVALFPAAALHVVQREEQLGQWLGGIGRFGGPGGMPLGDGADLENRAYRALIVAPLVIGLSLLFALLNLSLAVSFLLCLKRPRWRPLGAGVIAGLLVATALSSPHLMLDGPAYNGHMRPDLWENKPLLALILEWSGRVATQWAPAAELAHRHLLLSYRFEPILPTR